MVTNERRHGVARDMIVEFLAVVRAVVLAVAISSLLHPLWHTMFYPVAHSVLSLSGAVTAPVATLPVADVQTTVGAAVFARLFSVDIVRAVVFAPVVAAVVAAVMAAAVAATALVVFMSFMPPAVARRILWVGGQLQCTPTLLPPRGVVVRKGLPPRRRGSGTRPRLFLRTGFPGLPTMLGDIMFLACSGL
jgi:hypothetical protein